MQNLQYSAIGILDMLYILHFTPKLKMVEIVGNWTKNQMLHLMPPGKDAVQHLSII